MASTMMVMVLSIVMTATVPRTLLYCGNGVECDCADGIDNDGNGDTDCDDWIRFDTVTCPPEDCSTA